MSIYKEGKICWFSFVFRGDRFQRSTRQSDRRVVRLIEAAFRTALAKGEVDIQERKPAPSLSDFSQRFLDNVGLGCRRAPRESTVMFYTECLNQILSYGPLAGAKLDAITPELVEKFIKSRRAGLSPSRINGLLRTLRRCLQVALDLDIIVKVPKITLLQGERERDFVLSPEQETVYLSTCPQPLADLAVFLLETGMRLGEACNLLWRDVHLEPLNGSRFGFAHVKISKTRYGQRDIHLTERASKMLRVRRRKTRSVWVFENEEGSGPLSKSTVCHQHIGRRRLLKMPKGLVIHSPRHTMLNRLGASGADVFLIKKIAGHSSVTVSEKYIHPVPRSVEAAFERFEEMGSKALPEGSSTTGAATIFTTLKDGQKASSNQVS
jgi:integrase